MVGIAASLFVLAAAALVNEVGAACSSPYTRPSWSDLSSSQKAAYVAAAKKLYERPSSGQCVDPNTASHRDFTQCHFSYQGDNHSTPWHRRFIRAYELALQSIDPSVVLPYMDWQQYSQAPHRADIWNDEYFGPNGDASKGGCVTEGTFGGTIVTFKNGGSTYSQCFKRNWNQGDSIEALVPSEAVMGLLDDPNFSTVSSRIENGPHAKVHVHIGGDMNTMYSTADPVFFLHHAYIDRLWWYWQTACPAWANNFAASTSHQLTPYSERVSNVMSTLDGPFCYTYSRRDSDRALGKCPKQQDTPQPSTPPKTSAAPPAPAATSAAGGSNGGSGTAGGSNGGSGAATTGGAPAPAATGTTTSSQTAATGTASAKWLQNVIVDLAPGVPKKLHRRAGVGDAAFYNNTEIHGLNQTGLNNIVLSDTPVIPDDYVPRSFTGKIAVYSPPKKTVKTAKELEAAQAKGDNEVVLVLTHDDTTDLENLRHVPNLPLDYIKMMRMDVAKVRYVETYINTLVDVINMTPGYTSPDALKNVCK
ncbi:hypothetical protein BJ742DRAFT_712219 [Cladochytrium replicatum]|nr:hypothetical protein BJ742DRAFT_712219 [Cladochytrium replicatum]